MAPRPARALVLSIAVHAGAAALGLYAWSRGPLDRLAARTGGGRALSAVAGAMVREIAAEQVQEEVRSARAALVRDARAAASEGRLSLGDFLLRANAIDARGAGRPLDATKLGALYRQRVDALRRARATQPLVEATAAVFADLSYFGSPGGLVADVLSNGGGACEPLAQLVAATLVDAGEHARVRLLFYGGGDVQHLAPIVQDERGERWDVMTGGPPLAGGVEIDPLDLVEIYARAHDGAARSSESHPSSAGAVRSGGAARATAGGAGALSLARGYPRNGDAFGGGMPLFARRAIRAPGDAVSPAPMQNWEDCAFFLPLGMLAPPKLTVWLDGAGDAGPSSVDVDLVFVPKGPEMERSALVAELVERSIDTTDTKADQIMALSCLAALYEKSATDFSLIGQPQMVAQALERLASARERGGVLVGSLADDPASAEEAEISLARRFSGRSWLALKLPGGSGLVLDIVERSIEQKPRSWGLIHTLAALTVAPETRARSLEIIATLPLADRVDVMHEVYHAHDHLPPWSAGFVFDDASIDSAATELTAAYAVFRKLSWRLWEGRRGTAEITGRLVAEARGAGLGADWEAALLAYYGDNLLGLYQHREGGMEVVAELSDVVDARPHPLLVPLQRRLAFLREKNRLDVATLAEAFRASGPR